MNKYSSLKLSQFLKDKGFDKPASKWWRKHKGEWRLSSIVTYVPAYDLLWDLCICYKDDVFGNEISPAVVKPFWEEPQFKIFHLLQQGKTEEVEQVIIDYFKTNE